MVKTKDRYIFKQLVLLGCLLLVYSSSFSQGWRIRYSVDMFSEPWSQNEIQLYSFQLNDSTYLGGGFAGSWSFRSVRYDKDQKQLSNVKISSSGFNKGFLPTDNCSRSHWKDDSAYYVVCKWLTHDNNTNYRYKGCVMKFNLMGDTLFKKEFADTTQAPEWCFNSVERIGKNRLLLTGNIYDESDTLSRPMSAIMDDNGQFIKATIYKNLGIKLSASFSLHQKLNNLNLIFIQSSPYHLSIQKNYYQILVCDSLGNLLKATKLDTNYASLYDAIPTTNGIVAVGNKPLGMYNCAALYRFTVNNDYSISLKDTLFNYNASPSFEFKTINQLPGGDLLVGGLSGGTYHGLISYTRYDPVTLQQKWHNRYNYNVYELDKDGPIPEEPLLHHTTLTSDSGWLASIGIFRFGSPRNRANPPYVLVKYDKNGCDTTDAYCKQFYPTGLLESAIRLPTFQLQPNPASGQFLIQANEEGVYRVMVYDVTGRLVLQNNHYSPNQPLSIKDLKSGVYTVCVYKESWRLGVKKLIVE